MKTKILLQALLFFLIIGTVGAQTSTIKGRIKTSDDKPAEFVNIGLQGTAKGASTNNKGEYLIKNVDPGNYKLVASFVGLETKEQNIQVKEGETLTVDFILNESAQKLSEVTVSAFKGTSYKTDDVSPALRINTPILEVPQNIQVITKDVIDSQQAFEMIDGVSRNVSGAQKVEHWDNYARINMRGSQVTAFRNGINTQMPWGPLSEDMSMVERIEFVKGPAGFMLSSGEPGGFYNIVTKKPTGNNTREVSLTAGSFGTYRTTADIDGRFNKKGKLLYRLNIMGQKKGSHRDFEYNNRYSIAPVLKYQMNDKTAITLEYNQQFSEMSAIGSNYAFSKKAYADLPRNFTTAEENLDPSRINEQNLLLNFEHNINDNWKFVAQASYIKYDLIGQSLWPWGIDSSNDSLMQRGISIWDALGINKNAQAFVNGKVKTGAVNHNILSGIDASHKSYFADWSQFAALGGPDFNIYAQVYGTIPDSELPVWDRSVSLRDRESTVHYDNSYNAFYVQDEIGFFENKVRLTLAGRYTMLSSANPYEGDINHERFTPRAGLSFSIAKNTTAYAVYDQAFLANPGLDFQGKSFDPVTGDNVEMGVKRDWFGGKWNSAVSVYQITKNNVLTADLENPDTNTGNFVFSRQTGQQQAQGIELDVKGQLVKGLSVIVNYAYTDAKITRDSDPAVVGNMIPGATRHIHNSWLNYKFSKGSLNGLMFSLGYQYQAGRSSWFVFDGTENSLPDYFRLDGGIGYQKGKVAVNLTVNNILNDYLYSGAPYGGIFYWQAEPGTSGRVSVAYKF